MPETRRAAKRRRVVEGPLLPPLHLPLPVVGHVLGYLDLSSLLRTAACSTALRKKDFDDEHNGAEGELRKRIDFIRGPKKPA